MLLVLNPDCMPRDSALQDYAAIADAIIESAAWIAIAPNLNRGRRSLTWRPAQCRILRPNHRPVRWLQPNQRRLSRYGEIPRQIMLATRLLCGELEDLAVELPP